MATKRVSIDKQVCVNCGICVDTCEKGVFVFDKGGVDARNVELCQGCWKCVEKCPVNAICIRSYPEMLTGG